MHLKAVLINPSFSQAPFCMFMKLFQFKNTPKWFQRPDWNLPISKAYALFLKTRQRKENTTKGGIRKPPSADFLLIAISKQWLRHPLQQQLVKHCDPIQHDMVDIWSNVGKLLLYSRSVTTRSCIAPGNH